MKRIQINSFIFEEIISSKQIEERVSEVARQINSEYQGKKPIFIPVLNGSFMFDRKANIFEWVIFFF